MDRLSKIPKVDYCPMRVFIFSCDDIFRYLANIGLLRRFMFRFIALMIFVAYPANAGMLTINDMMNSPHWQDWDGASSVGYYISLPGGRIIDAGLTFMDLPYASGNNALLSNDNYFNIFFRGDFPFTQNLAEVTRVGLYAFASDKQVHVWLYGRHYECLIDLCGFISLNELPNFFGYQDDRGIGVVQISSGTAGGQLIMDDLRFDNLPEPSMMLLLLLGSLFIPFRRTKHAAARCV